MKSAIPVPVSSRSPGFAMTEMFIRWTGEMAHQVQAVALSMYYCVVLFCHRRSSSKTADLSVTKRDGPPIGLLLTSTCSPSNPITRVIKAAMSQGLMEQQDLGNED